MSIILFFAVLAILILAHELGHFLFAKLSKIKVEEFGFGFPPRVFGFRRGETIYSFNLIPFGGFVKICGEDGSPSNLPAEALTRSFGVQKAYIRALVLSAGVLFNLLLAWSLLTATYLIGAPVSVEENGIPGNYFKEKGVMIIQIQEGMPAELSDLRPGDYLLRFFGKNEKTLEISDIKEVQNFIANHPEEEIRMDYLRKGKVFSTKAIPLKNPENGKGILGIAMEKVGIVRLPFHRAIWEGLKTTVRLTGLIAEAFVDFFTGIFTERKILAQIAGPVGIAGIIASAAQSGPIFILQLVALLSINLALINFLPFPALDGGRLMFLAIEVIRRKPISAKFSNIAHNLGFAILISLMLIITYLDILKLMQ